MSGMPCSCARAAIAAISGMFSLGLPMVYGIIREHHGDVDVESEPGKGSIFRIKLPRNPLNLRDGGHVPGKAVTALHQDQSQRGN